MIRVVSSSRVESRRNESRQENFKVNVNVNVDVKVKVIVNEHFLFFADRLLENATIEETHVHTILLYAYGTLPCHYMLCYASGRRINRFLFR